MSLSPGGPTDGALGEDGPVKPPRILRLDIRRYRGLVELSWHPAPGLNVILGGGDVGKSTVLDAIGLLLSPSNPTTLAETDYFQRNIDAGFEIEAVMSLPPESGIDYQFKPSWPWVWNGTEAVAPTAEGTGEDVSGQAVYKLRVRGTADLELLYEIVQPNLSPDTLSAGLRRAIGLVRLGGDDRHDRDLRLVQGSALDRLLSDQTLRSKVTSEVGKTDVRGRLLPDKLANLTKLDGAFRARELPAGLDLSLIGGPGASVLSLVGLTADAGPVKLPLSSWGAGTRRLAALEVARQNQGHAPVTIVDEVERGLEPYRQRVLLERIQSAPSQAIATTHSPFVIAAADKAAFWYLDSAGNIGGLDGTKIEHVRANDPGAFLARLTIVAEGATEKGFCLALLERAIKRDLGGLGIHVCDGGGHELTLGVLKALCKSGLCFGGVADNEGKYENSWKGVQTVLGDRLLRWESGCIEDNVLGLLTDAQLEQILTTGEEAGARRRTLQERLNTPDKTFAELSAAAAAGAGLRGAVLQAAKGVVPDGLDDELKKRFKSHAQTWFKSVEGGRELEGLIFTFGLWPGLKPTLLPFCNGIRHVLGHAPVADLAP
jgi:putative ATP-dependent endonuclease of OLD family